MFTDPGSIPQEAVPLASLFKKGVTTHAMCSHCQTYKPPHSHHCRICNRCISNMDRTYYQVYCFP
jgi:ribosomal protein L40E